MVNLYNTLNDTYKTKKASANRLANEGYVFDNKLSNISTRIYHNPTDNKVLLTSRGTHNFWNDLPLDLHIFNNSIKQSQRFRETKSIYNKAKEKYNVDGLTLAGHSAGGSLVSALGGVNDAIYTYNKGKSLFDFHKEKSNEKSFRHKNDLVSISAKYDNNTTNLGSYFDTGILENHSLMPLKNLNLVI